MKNLVPFDINLSQSIAMGGGFLEIFRLEVPIKAEARIKEFGNYLDVFGAWQLVQWVFKLNGCVVYPYHNILDQLGYSADMRAIVMTDIKGGDVFTIEITNNDPANNVICGICLRWEIGEPD